VRRTPLFLRCITFLLSLSASVISFGGLQGVELLCFVAIECFLDVGSQIAGARKPLQSGLAVTIAIETSSVFYCSIASLALINYGVTLSSVVVTAILSHEDALRPFFYSLTNHGYHLPSGLAYKKTRLRATSSGFSMAKRTIYVSTSC
jgi:hypothetical protein